MPPDHQVGVGPQPGHVVPAADLEVVVAGRPLDRPERRVGGLDRRVVERAGLPEHRPHRVADRVVDLPGLHSVSIMSRGVAQIADDLAHRGRRARPGRRRCRPRPGPRRRPRVPARSADPGAAARPGRGARPVLRQGPAPAGDLAGDQLGAGPAGQQAGASAQVRASSASSSTCSRRRLADPADAGPDHLARPSPHASRPARPTQSHFTEEWVSALIVGSSAARHQQPGAVGCSAADHQGDHGHRGVRDRVGANAGASSASSRPIGRRRGGDHHAVDRRPFPASAAEPTTSRPGPSIAPAPAVVRPHLDPARVPSSATSSVDQPVRRRRAGRRRPARPAGRTELPRRARAATRRPGPARTAPARPPRRTASRDSPGVHPAEQRLEQPVGHLGPEPLVHVRADRHVAGQRRRRQLRFGGRPRVAGPASAPRAVRPTSVGTPITDGGSGDRPAVDQQPGLGARSGARAGRPDPSSAIRSTRLGPAGQHRLGPAVEPDPVELDRGQLAAAARRRPRAR